jgi:hypothetical protein
MTQFTAANYEFKPQIAELICIFAPNKGGK